jgi:hypothetical protein
VLLGLLSLLGLLAMHDTPSMASMPHPAAPHVSGSNVGPGSMALQAMDIGLSNPSEVGVSWQPDVMIGEPGHGQQLPKAHMAAPCVSDTARTTAYALASMVLAASPAEPLIVGQPASGPTMSNIERAPPDLTELCISRT